MASKHAQLASSEIKQDWAKGHHRSSTEISDGSLPLPVARAYAEHGPTIDRTDTADEREEPMNAGLAWPRIRRALREPFSEFIGTFILIMFGDGVVAQVVLSKDTYGEYQSISWGWVGLNLKTFS